MSFEKRIEFKPAFDKRHKDPKKNYGIHGVECIFSLIGEKGAIVFVLFTSWNLPHVQKETDSKPLNDIPYMFHKPNPAYIEFHSHNPTYEGQEATDNCKLLNGECYWDRGHIIADNAFNVLVEKGSEGFWKHLESLYNNMVKDQGR